ncbi:WASH complex subunit 5 isoform X1 [Neodiprion fabricii]|uniref:WASH complex subunit 5 isoform X1 n=1 Tax=Neodiprion fabricii TaxID=2872261 RepID=UPI001ED8FBA9|nr:WASH complex subunit 5 isoform X1 [Neodiprion fabricii]
MGDFLALNNGCGQNILQLVSRGNAIIAELMRLKDYVPPIFRQADQRYSQIILDFSYFKAADAYEHKIENDSVSQELDEEMRDTFSDILTRFYLAFESIHKYVTDLNAFTEELEDGIYIQQSIETIMLSEEGKQLMCEAVYLYGVMLLLVDLHFEGPIRERLLVSYYRYNVQHISTTRVDDVCVLLRSTGFSNAPFKRPANYPEAYFKRIPLNTLLVDLVISRLRSDEIYNQSLAFPYPEHRSMALASQAAMLVVALAFSPSTLHSQTSIMRETVDRFFPDNWVISIYMGLVLNLWDWWEPYKAAKNALNNTFEVSNVKQIAQKYGQKLKKQVADTKEFQLSKRVEENAIGNTVKLVRDCNVTLHWILLHTSMPGMFSEGSKRSRSIRQLVIQESKYIAIECLWLLLNTAQLEQDVKQMYKQLLTDKETIWTRHKEICVERISGLAEVFSGNRPLDGVEKNECLQIWFKEIGKHVDSLQQDEGRKIVQLFQALEEVQEFHQLEHNLHISQYLADTRDILQRMLRTSSITEDVMIALNIVTDCSYAWNIMESFISIMQECIKKDPPMVTKLKPLFSKMASALETPLLRINQAHSSDLSSVSQHYSRELEVFARHVLQVIPETVFGLLAQIVDLETNHLKEIPLRLSKDKLREYAQLDDRLKVAKLTYTVSVFTEGVLALKSVSLGILLVDSHQLLEDGIRQELVEKITLALHSGLTFDAKSKTSELLKKLEELAVVIDGYRRSFQYIQDYININSLKIWQEEITFIINDAVEQECKGLIWVPGRRNLRKNKINSLLVSNDSNSINFMGRIVRELLRVTDPKTTVYIEHTIAWYDLKTQTEVLNHKIFSGILKAMGIPGLTGLDKLISFLAFTEIEKCINYLEKGFQDKVWIDVFNEFNNITENTDTPKGKHYQTISSRCAKTWPPMLDWVLKIGHMQMLRKKIAYELNIACKFNAKQVEMSLRTFNNAIISEICSNRDWDQQDPVRKDLLRNLSTRLNWAGMNDPYEKQYVNATKTNNIEMIIFLLTVSQLPKIYYSRKLASLLSKKAQDPVDAVVFVIGVQTILHQCNAAAKEDYVSHLCQYILSFEISDGSKNAQILEEEGITGLNYLEEFVKYSNLPKSAILKHIPLILLDQYHTKTMK